MFFYALLKYISICLFYVSHLRSFYAQKKDDFQSVVMEHLRMNGAYWGLTALDILGKLNTVDADEVVSWVMSCQHESGKFPTKFTVLVCASG